MENLSNTSPSIDTVKIRISQSPEGLISWSKAEFKRAGIPFTYFNEDLLHLVRQDLELVRGKTLKVLIHNFGRDWETAEGCAFQTEQGCDGNAAAYLIWVTKTKLTGRSVSIANDAARLFRYSDILLCAPRFFRDIRRCELRLIGARFKWDGDTSLVAFSAI